MYTAYSKSGFKCGLPFFYELYSAYFIQCHYKIPDFSKREKRGCAMKMTLGLFLLRLWRHKIKEKNITKTFNDGSNMILLLLRRGCYSEIHRKSQSSGMSAFCSLLCLVTANTNLQLIKNKIFCYINDDE